MSRVRKSIIGALVLVPITFGIIKWIKVQDGHGSKADRKSERRTS
jgi:hypothetical protein